MPNSSTVSKAGAPASGSTAAQRRVRTPTATDAVLGAFRHVQPNDTLDHAIRYLGTWSGTDKVLMVTQYSSKLLIALLSLQHTLRLRLRGATPHHVLHGGSKTATKFERLASIVGDARVLFRIWGILPILQWMISLERVPPPTRLLHQVERVQGWSMLFYCPAEVLAYLAGHGVITLSARTQGRLWLWSARAWALYVALQLLHLVEDNRILRLRARALERSRGHPAPPSGRQEKKITADASGADEEASTTSRMWEELDDRKRAILNELWVNLGYLPLTVHWSHPAGIFNEAWVGFFGVIAGAAGLRAGWRNSAKPAL